MNHAAALPGITGPLLPTWDDFIDRARGKWRDLVNMATVLTNAGRAILTNRIIAGGTEPNHIGWGTGAGTAAAADTSLFTEVANDLATTTGSRTTGTSSRVTTSVTNDTYQVVGTKTASASGTVTNAGLFDNVTMGSGSLFMKGDFTGIALANGDSIQFTFKLQFN